MTLEIENEKLKEACKLAGMEAEKDTIGVLSEHTLHRVMKFYLTSDVNNQEIKIGRMFADVMIDGKIYEVQTKAFNAMRGKLDVFLKDYDVTIVHPMAQNKVTYLSDSDGNPLNNKKSPRHLYPLEIMWELYKIKNYLLDEHLHFKIIMVDMDEFRIQTTKKRWHSKGYERLNQIPNKINRIYDINKPSDWVDIISEYGLPENFDSKVFSKKCHLTIKKGTTALNVLTYLGVVERIGKDGRSYIYKLNKNK